ncbi:C39 family peptidase [Sphingobium sp. PNB]|uniref:C39 family peptidase n=1 Tax=Sphingobium sp. PNB TaxID=863934 RepID=UPI001CA420D5|nr:C39 family peptidase [Sphingobium sp. PNB]MCB4858174.1 C39 family peptidase [Sphingobium sp. PNB]
MSRSSNRIGAAALLALSGCAAPQGAGSGLGLGRNDYVLPVRSMVERRFLTVVRQRYDFSCGSAALATLLHFHYGDVQTEQSIFLGMWRDGDREQIRKQGFSLLDMKRYLAARGIGSDGYQVTLQQIAATRIPGIALINMNGYLHFVVVKGVENGQVMVGDPSLGIRLISARRFQAMWNRILFVVNDRPEAAKASFGKDSDWALVARSRATALMEPVSLQALALTRPQAFPPEL